MVQLTNIGVVPVSARACRNSLLWYNQGGDMVETTLLGLVGIPCYGTIATTDATTDATLGLVGIPCYGTITGVFVHIVATARACRNSLLWYNLQYTRYYPKSARACRNSLLWYNEPWTPWEPWTARACRNSLLWYNVYVTDPASYEARACRNSLLWYNVSPQKWGFFMRRPSV